MTITEVSTAVRCLSEAERARRDALAILTEALRQAEGADLDRVAFQSLFGAAIRTLELDHEAIARALRTSRPTISRWESGQSAPHPIGRASVLRELRKMTQARSRQYA